MFVVLIIQDFEFEGLRFPITVDVGKMVGFLPVYRTREEALEDFPDAKLAEIRELNTP